MNRNEVRDALYPNCPIRNVLSRVGDKWSMLVLFTLENNDCQRFKELQRNIPAYGEREKSTAAYRQPPFMGE